MRTVRSNQLSYASEYYIIIARKQKSARKKSTVKESTINNNIEHNAILCYLIY